MQPQPNVAWYNDWRRLEAGQNVPPLDAFTPTMPVSVVVPSYRTPADTLARTLAGLECQTYPPEMFEVVIVDDGTEPPLSPPASSLNVKLVRQAHRSGRAGARNAGARSAAHEILLFLDSDVVAEAHWIAAHARWHHRVADALTVGFNSRVAIPGPEPSAAAIAGRSGPLADVFAGYAATPPWAEGHLLRSNDLTARSDDPYWAMGGSNFGIGRGFHDLIGGSDEAFVKWGLEDAELAYRGYVYGGLLVACRDAAGWHQGAWDEAKNQQGNRAQRALAASRIPHPKLRQPSGQCYRVPQHVVTVGGRGKEASGSELPSAAQLAATVMRLGEDRAGDLVVRIATSVRDEADESRCPALSKRFRCEPNVRLATEGSALDEFPTAAFHVSLPATARFAKDLIYRLRAGLGDAVAARAILPGDREVSIARTWALHRARRTGRRIEDFGRVRQLSPTWLRLTEAAAGVAPKRALGLAALSGRAGALSRRIWSLLVHLVAAAWLPARSPRRLSRYLWWRGQRRRQRPSAQ